MSVFSSTPTALQVHGVPPSGHDSIRTGRLPSIPSMPSGAPTTTRSRTAPRSGSTTGTSTVNSRTAAQPASSAARMASSTKTVPGSTTVPCTA
jgi:hypothetical protein